MDPILLARIQFAVTIGFHFLFPPITIGLAWLLVIAEWKGWRRGDEDWARIGKFFAKVLGLTFAVGVATGIVMEFQFGTNWSRYSRFVGDIFGAPLAAEGVFAFFLESGFLGLYLFGRRRISKGAHWFSCLMVAAGSTLSAFWILVANSWQQTPAGYVLRNGRAELVDFWAAVFNPSTLVRFTHTIFAAILSGAFFWVGITAWMVLRKRGGAASLKALKLGVGVGLVSALVVLFPTGHEHARQVARTQPEKFAAIEGLYETQAQAPLVMFAVPRERPPKLHAVLEIKGLLSWMAFGDFNAKIQGINEFPPDEIPPLALTFISFHTMVGLGMLFILLMAVAAWKCWKKRLESSPRLLKVLVWCAPLPLLACQIGWVTAEVGRQPWIVYRMMKTADAVSVTVTAGELLFSLALLSVIYLLLGSLYVFLLVRKVRGGLEETPTPDAP
ncbi:MAG: cytochrome ubiquinol oxidase subunit I [Acidobacteria bacterium]|nr:cytochrome ubiquinol oxidase subunit I [Acidobacteriota bacterium]